MRRDWLPTVALLATSLFAADAGFAQAGNTQPGAAQRRAAQFAQLQYWPGYWVSDGLPPTPISGISPRVTDPAAPQPDSLGLWAKNIPWNAAGRLRVAEVLRTQGGRKALGWGFPLMMNAPTPLQFLITPEEVLIINAYGEARHVYTDGRAHPPGDDLWPTATGNSIGRWDGDTLVIDTIMVTNPNEFFQGSPPLSEQARYVERIRLDGERLTAQVTIEDPMTLSAPWVSRIGWVRDKGFDRMIQVDWTNDRTGRDENGINTIEPPAEKRGK
ncbi:MAG: hypothetical protein ABIT09_02130 [Croceibacterium sp.]